MIWGARTADLSCGAAPSGQSDVDLVPVSTIIELVVEVVLVSPGVRVRGGEFGLSTCARAERRSVVVAPGRKDAKALAVRLGARATCSVPAGIADAHGPHCKRYLGMHGLTRSKTDPARRTRCRSKAPVAPADRTRRVLVSLERGG